MATTNPQSPSEIEAEIEAIKKAASTTSIENIVQDFNSGVLEAPNAHIPLGDDPLDITPLPDRIQSSPQGNFPDPAPETILQDLDNLESELNAAQLDGQPSPQSIASFQGLKARYNNKIKDFKNTIANYATKESALTEQLQQAQAYQVEAQKATQLEGEMESVREQNKQLQLEIESLSLFRKKYDLENDPHIKAEYVSPMNTLKTRSIDIIKHSRNPNLWNDLIKAESEYEINSLIEQGGVTGLNSQALKSYVTHYRTLNHELSQISQPEHIDSAIQVARGKSITASAEQAETIFQNLKTSFSDHVKELRESDFNREHNIFVHDRVAAQAKQNYDNLRGALGETYQNPAVLRMIGTAALMSAAYPAQDIMVKNLLKRYSSLLSEVRALKGTPDIKQTRERSNGNTFTGDWEDIKAKSSKPISDIVRDSSR